MDKKEKIIIDAYERGELKSVSNKEQYLKQAKQTAQNTLKKDRSITIRLNSWDVERLQSHALYEGLPYQTYIASQLHKLAEGRLKEIDKD